MSKWLPEPHAVVKEVLLIVAVGASLALLMELFPGLKRYIQNTILGPR